MSYVGKEESRPQRSWRTLLKILSGVSIALLAVSQIFLKDPNVRGVWIARAQLERGELLNIARTSGADGKATTYFRSQASGDWRSLSTWLYATDDENSPISAFWHLSRDGRILCDNTAKNAQWFFDLDSQKLTLRELTNTETLAQFNTQLSLRLAKHGALQPVKPQPYRLSAWIWGDRETKQLRAEFPVEFDQP